MKKTYGQHLRETAAMFYSPRKLGAWGMYAMMGVMGLMGSVIGAVTVALDEGPDLKTFANGQGGAAAVLNTNEYRTYIVQTDEAGRRQLYSLPTPLGTSDRPLAILTPLSYEEAQEVVGRLKERFEAASAFPGIRDDLRLEGFRKSFTVEGLTPVIETTYDTQTQLGLYNVLRPVFNLLTVDLGQSSPGTQYAVLSRQSIENPAAQGDTAILEANLAVLKNLDLRESAYGIAPGRTTAVSHVAQGLENGFIAGVAGMNALTILMIPFFAYGRRKADSSGPEATPAP